jgi:hypothetical protein
MFQSKKDLVLHLFGPLFRLLPLPRAFVGGGMKCATTAVHDWISKHPEVDGGLLKETYFWNQKTLRGQGAYRANYISKKFFRKKISMDGTPQYMCTPFAKQRIEQVVNQPKMILLLREPVSRTISSYVHARARGWTTRSFEEELEFERETFPSAKQALMLEWTESYETFLRHAHGWQSTYAWQIDSTPPGIQVLVLFLEKFIDDPKAKWEKICRFLEVSHCAAPRLEFLNVSPPAEAYGPFPVPVWLRLRFQEDSQELLRRGVAVPWVI